MELNNETLANITRMAAAAFTPAQIAFSIGVNTNEFKQLIADENSEACAAYFKGFYSNELAIRESTFQLARNGSSPAQTLALKIFEQTRTKIIQDGTASEEI